MSFPEGFINLDAKRGIFRAAGAGLGKIGVNYIPLMRSIGPVKPGVPSLTLSQVKTLTAAGEAPPPETFSWKPPQILPPGNQSACGSCYAYSSTQCLADRWAIARKVQPPPNLAVKVTAGCVDAHCGGGLPINCGHFFEERGVPLDSCAPYASFCGPDVKTNCSNPPCQADVCSEDHWFATKGSTAYISDIDAAITDEAIRDNITKIKLDIYHNGPLVCCFYVFDDFMARDKHPDSWPNGIYKRDAAKFPDGSTDSGHAVAIVGYGPDYWLIRNSWGTHWNDGGYVKVYDGLHGNKGVGFDHTIVGKGGAKLGGTITFKASPVTGNTNYGASSVSGALGSVWFWLLLLLVLGAGVAIGIYWWRQRSRRGGGGSVSFL